MKKSLPWGVVIVILIWIFPVGIWLVWRKMSIETLNMQKNGKTLRVIGFIFAGISLMYLALGLTGELKAEDNGSIVGGIIIILTLLGGGGLAAIISGNKYIKNGKKYDKYAAIINESGENDIDSIAAIYQASYDEAVDDLQKMIDYGYFPNAYIDQSNRKLILSYSHNDNEEKIVREEQKEPEMVKCPNCGAMNSIALSRDNKCEYCGSEL